MVSVVWVRPVLLLNSHALKRQIHAEKRPFCSDGGAQSGARERLRAGRARRCARLVARARGESLTLSGEPAAGPVPRPPPSAILSLHCHGRCLHSHAPRPPRRDSLPWNGAGDGADCVRTTLPPPIRICYTPRSKLIPLVCHLCRAGAEVDNGDPTSRRPHRPRSTRSRPR